MGVDECARLGEDVRNTAFIHGITLQGVFNSVFCGFDRRSFVCTPLVYLDRLPTACQRDGLAFPMQYAGERTGQRHLINEPLFALSFQIELDESLRMGHARLQMREPTEIGGNAYGPKARLGRLDTADRGQEIVIGPGRDQ